MPEDVSKLTPHNDGRRRRMYMKQLSAVAILPDVRGANPEANVTFFKSTEKQGRRRPGETEAEYRRRTKKQTGPMEGESFSAFLARMRREDPEMTESRARTMFNNAEKQSRRRQRRRGEEEDSSYKVAFTAAEKGGGDLVDLVTSVDEGHQHGVSIYVDDGEFYMVTTYAMSEDAERPHDHQLVRNEDGSYSILENAGHTHDDLAADVVARVIADRMTKSQDPEGGSSADTLKQDETGGNTVKEEHPMTEQEKQEFEALKAENATLKAVLRMTPAQKAHYDTLDSTDQEAFAKMGASARDAAVKAGEEANPEVFKSVDGTVYRQNDDPRLVQMAKQADEQAKELAKERARNSDRDLTKRAEDTLTNLPGEIKVHKAMLKALDGIEDEEIRKAAHEALVAGNNAFNLATKTVGTSAAPRVVAGQDVAKSAEAELDQIAEDIQKADPKLSKLQALEKAYEQRPDLLEKAVG